MAVSYQRFFKLILPSFVIFNLSFVILSGCGDITGEVASIEISPSTVTVGTNQSQAFTAIGKNSVGQIVSISPAWSVQGGIGTISSIGLLTAGAAEASGNVMATVGALSGTAAVTITKNGWLKGNVKDTNGSLVIGITVYLKQSRSLYNNQTDSSGNYIISSIPAGTYEADIDARGNTSAGSAEVTISEGQTVTQDFVLFTPTTVTTSTTLPF
ncbi:MAG: carboxypeptidase-like regulatory domain-containing protein [Candidatus Margulisbacteria bacterium]|nr:carboxypeptidase-like regulatory domain-containing protein [Candidatus Margulisiibacteriota bacterium]